MLLRALRKQFPGVVFFTTDFDALYVHPTEFAHTRNLLVASRFGLELRDEFQGPIPPFRDSYQTAQYYSCLRALHFFDHEEHQNEGTLPPLHRGWEAQVFEVGRDGAVNLGTRESLGISGTGRVAAIPHGERIPRKHFMATALSVFLLLGLMLVLASPTLRGQVSRNFKRGSATLTIFGALVVAFVVLLIVIAVVQSHPDEEPFSLFGGISIWPSTLLRAFIAVLAGFYIWRGYQYLDYNRGNLVKQVNESLADVELQMGPSDDDVTPETETGEDTQKSAPPIWRMMRALLAKPVGFVAKHAGRMPGAGKMRSLLKRIRGCFELANIRNAETFKDAWAAYVSLSGKTRCRFVRIGIILSAYFVFFSIAREAFDLRAAYQPVRGIHSFAIQNAVIGVSVLLTIVLVIFTIDANVLCGSIVSWIGRYFRRMPLVGDSKDDSDFQRKLVAHQQLIQLVAARVSAVSSLLYYPFACLLLLLVSRHAVFDNFDFPPLLTAVYIFAFASLVTTAMFLHRTAKKSWARARALLQEQQRHMLLSTGEQTPSGRIEAELSLLNALGNSPAFAALTHNPIIRAALIPLGGVGALQLMEYASKL